MQRVKLYILRPLTPSAKPGQRVVYAVVNATQPTRQAAVKAHATND